MKVWPCAVHLTEEPYFTSVVFTLYLTSDFLCDGIFFSVIPIRSEGEKWRTDAYAYTVKSEPETIVNDRSTYLLRDGMLL